MLRGLLPSDLQPTAAQLIRRKEDLIMDIRQSLEAENQKGSAGTAEDKRKTMVKEALSYIGVLLCTVFILSFVFTLNRIPSGSMEPTIRTGSVSVSWRLSYLFGNPTPKRGDIVTFREQGGSNRTLIKRVIAISGDTITFEQGKVFLNGHELDEPYLMAADSTRSLESEYTVPAGCVFVMGDNREFSNDSRFMEDPFIPIERIVAHYLFSFRSLLS